MPVKEIVESKRAVPFPSEMASPAARIYDTLTERTGDLHLRELKEGRLRINNALISSKRKPARNEGWFRFTCCLASEKTKMDRG